MPHAQIDQQPADPELRAALAERVFRLPGVHSGPSGISVPGAIAVILNDEVPTAPDAEFLCDREFAHLHPGGDHSLHVVLPADTAARVVEAGWAEPHPLAGIDAAPVGLIMVYAPRDRAEVDVVGSIVEAAHQAVVA